MLELSSEIIPILHSASRKALAKVAKLSTSLLRASGANHTTRTETGPESSGGIPHFLAAAHTIISMSDFAFATAAQ